MPWDVNSFLQQLNGGFEAGQLKRDEQDKMNAEQQKIAQEGAQGELKQAAGQSDLEFKQMKNKISLLQELVKLFDTGKKKKNPDGTEVDEPNPIKEMLKKNFESITSEFMSGYQDPIANMTSKLPQSNPIPQEYAPTPEPDPYQMPKQGVSSGANMNDMVSGITGGMDGDGGNSFMDSGTLQDYLKRYLQ